MTSVFIAPTGIHNLDALPSGDVLNILPDWEAGKICATGYVVRPDNMYMYRCTTAGTTGEVEPTWPTNDGGTVGDGSVVWTANINNPILSSINDPYNAPDDSAAYLTLNTGVSSGYPTFTWTNPIPTGSTINTVTVFARLQLPDGVGIGNSSAGVLMEVGTGVFFSSVVSIPIGTTDWFNRAFFWSTNPATLTSWAYDDLATLWFGAVLLSSDGIAQTRVTQCYMIIDYTPPGTNDGGDGEEDISILRGYTMRRSENPVPIWGGILATPTAVEIDMGSATQLVVRHAISGSPGTGGYCSLECGRRLTTDYLENLVANPAITSIARSTTTMTVTMSNPHTEIPLAVGDIVTISGSTQAIFNRTFTIATVPTSTTFTASIANSGATSATGGNIIPTVLYVPHSGEGTNIKAAATTSSYESVFLHCGPTVRLTCTITDGIHSVWIEKYI